MAYIETLIAGISATLTNIGPVISLILIVLGGITYGVAQTQPSEIKGKWQAIGIGMVVGGIIVAAILGAATIIRDTSLKLLT